MIEVCDLAPVTPFVPGADAITIRIDETPPETTPEIASATERRWAELLSENPRHFDGPILAIERFDPETNSIHARRDAYSRLAVEPEVDTGVQLLSVTGFLTALDNCGRPCVLLAQRSTQTRIHGGLWELAPSGGIDPPGADTKALGLDDIRAQLGAELREELGVMIDIANAHPIALCVDELGHSVDIVLRLDTGGAIDELHVSVDDTWEYTGVRWVELREVSVFACEHTNELIPSTRDLMRTPSLV